MKQLKMLKWLLAGLLLAEIIVFVYNQYIPKKYMSTYQLTSLEMFHMPERGLVASMKTLESLLNAHPSAKDRKYRVFASDNEVNRLDVKVLFENRANYLPAEDLSKILNEIEEIYTKSYRQNKSKIVESARVITGGQNLNVDISSLLLLDFFPHFEVVAHDKRIEYGINRFQLRLMLWASIFLLIFIFDQILKKRKQIF